MIGFIFINDRYARTLGMLLLFFVLTACSPQQENSVYHDGSDMHLKLAAFKLLAAIGGFELHAEVRLNDGAPMALTVNADNSISGTLTNIEQGNYDFTLRYFVIYSELPLTLAQFKQPITVASGLTTKVEISDNQLDRSFDQDGDGFTNLAEIRLNSNPFIVGDIPKQASLLSSLADASFRSSSSTNYQLRNRIGENWVSQSNGTNYRLRSGLSNY